MDRESKASKERKAEFKTPSGLPLNQVYTEADVATGLEDRLSLPGVYPFTRGVQSTMYRGRLWTMRQYAGFGSAKQTNERFRYLLDQGQTGLSTAFDLPTQIGYDADHPFSRGEVGKVGVSISSLLDMETLFEGIPLDRVSTSMTINAPASVLLAMYIAVGKKQGVDPQKLAGTIQNDILKEYVARGTYIYPPGPSMRLITDIFSYCAEHVPNFNTISISGYHMREAGSTAVQEIAFTLSNACAYVDAALKVGLLIDDFAPRLSFFFNAHNNFLEEIAKFRAARRMWARIMRESYGAKNPKSWQMRFHTQTGGSTLTAQQPDNNIVRVTVQALAAVLGGTQSLHTNSRDEALALPTETSARIALRTQQIIAFESGVADTVDPFAGSYAIEALTDQLEQEARAYMDEIARMGGAVRAIEEGFMQREIHQAAYETQLRIERGEEIVVGVNAFTIDHEVEPELLRVGHELEQTACAQLAELKKRRDAPRVNAALNRVTDAARSSDNLLEPMIEAVEHYATLGEVSDALRSVFGEYQGTR
ncbi:acyl-CoA mutase large subunit family protein [Ferroacidibacillus organovorans]|uniref:Methylmalonyl-CoA mutase n=2 Tax=Ferroacidibacillus organovorans TaxID=1765683 RepID=A0A1V4EUM2_9BACL|nr:methylmalonyl-CoA mutase family protein [Ferroacidibacillus organovorans]OPG16635.1 methylmalonyl-CoA mutase [Ferroacidibacillus organovorans]